MSIQALPFWALMATHLNRPYGPIVIRKISSKRGFPGRWFQFRAEQARHCAVSFSRAYASPDLARGARGVRQDAGAFLALP